MLRETRTRESFGEEEFVAYRLERVSSWERKHFPTPPAPSKCQFLGKKRGVV